MDCKFCQLSNVRRRNVHAHLFEIIKVLSLVRSQHVLPSILRRFIGNIRLVEYLGGFALKCIMSFTFESVPERCLP